MRRIVPLAPRGLCFAVALLIASPALVASPALAADLAPEVLKGDVEAFLQENQGGEDDGFQLTYGEVSVVDEGAGLRVTVPDVGLDVLDGAGPLPLGSVSFLVTPRDDGRYAFSEVAVPESLSRRDGKGAEVGSLAFDLVNLTGVWAPQQRELTDLDLLLRGVELRSAKAGMLLGLGRVAATLATTESAEGRWTQVQEYHADNLVLADEDAVVEVKSLALTSSYDDFNPETRRTLMALFEDLQTAAEAGDEGRLANLRDSLANLGDLSGTFKQRVEVADATVSDAAGQGLFTLRGASLLIDADTPRGSDRSSAGLTFAGEGLALNAEAKPELAPYIGLVPRSWSLPLSVDNVPNDAAMRALADLLAEMASDPGKDLDLPLSAAGRGVIEALGAAGSRILVRGLYVDSELTRLEGKASLLFSPSTPLGVVGNTDLTLTGLDRVLALAEGLSDPDVKRGMSATALGLMGVGQATALPDGRVGYRYSFLLAPDGSVQMNGLAFGDLLNRAIPQ